MQATITQGNITLSPPEGDPTGVDTLVLSMSREGTSPVLVDGKMEDQGTYTTGISEGIMDPAHAVMSSAAVCGQCPGLSHALFQSNETHWSGI